MNWMRVLGCVKQRSGCSSTLLCHAERYQNGTLFVGRRLYYWQGQGGYPLERKTSWSFKLSRILVDTVFGSKNTSLRYEHSMQNDPDLSRGFLVQLWLADRKKMRLSGKRRHKILKSIDNGATLVNGRTFPKLFDRIVSGKYDVDEKSYDKIKSSFKQPPTSQSITGTLEPMSLAEVVNDVPSVELFTSYILK